MSCEDRRDQVLLFVAGELEDSATAELRGHLRSGCPQCAGHLAEAEAILAHLPLSLEPVQPPASVKSRLMARVSSSASVADEAAARRPRPDVIPSKPRSLADLWLRPALAAGLAAWVWSAALL